MSSLENRIALKQQYTEVVEVLYHMATQGGRFGAEEVEILRPMLESLFQNARKHRECARLLAPVEGESVLRWMAAQWPKRDFDLDGHPEQERIARVWADYAIQAMDTINDRHFWCIRNLMEVHEKVADYVVREIFGKELGLYRYDLSPQYRDGYEYEAPTEEEARSSHLLAVVQSLAQNEQFSLLANVLSGIHEAKRLAPEIIDKHSQYELFIACFINNHSIEDSKCIEQLGQLAKSFDEEVADKLKGRGCDSHLRYLINAARSGFVEFASSAIERIINAGVTAHSFRFFLGNVERYTNVDMPSIVTRYALNITNNDGMSYDHKAILLHYFSTTANPIIPDLIEFAPDDYALFQQVYNGIRDRNEEPDQFEMNISNFKNLMCEYLGQCPGMLNVMAGNPTIGKYVKTLPYWHDQNLAIDLGL